MFKKNSSRTIRVLAFCFCPHFEGAKKDRVTKGATAALGDSLWSDHHPKSMRPVPYVCTLAVDRYRTALYGHYSRPLEVTGHVQEKTKLGLQFDGN